MYTGLVREIGHITSLDKKGIWTVKINAPATQANLEIGSSVSCSGICLTVTALDEEGFTVQLSEETLNKTTAKNWQTGQAVNIEPSLRAGDEIGGHWVSGHIDGVLSLISRSEGTDDVRLVFAMPEGFSKLIAPKGSIALDGVSLTVNDVTDAQFSITIISHTQKVTTFGACKAGDLLNFEIDMLARYIDRILAHRGLS
ncbi:MAG: riboflavin synthase [Alphaproteobacteria bacterium]|nr:riboflavin synthase [Alphaproteobacteria bacterium]